LNVFTTCGFKPFFDQTRCTVLCDTPAWRPMLRTLQRLRFFGGRVASVTTRSIFFAVIDGLRPRPLLSLRPSRLCASKRLDHIDTVGIDVFSCLATVSIFSPSRRSRMIFARKRSRCALVRALALRCSSARISAPAVMTLMGRAIP
jgi:hypothetical protein